MNNEFVKYARAEIKISLMNTAHKAYAMIFFPDTTAPVGLGLSP
jgi:hypothetical protein